MPDSGGGFEAPIPQVGDLVVSPREASGLIVRGVTTPEGCSFNLESRGNTAILPTPQAWKAGGTKINLEHWTIASDGHPLTKAMKQIPPARRARSRHHDYDEEFEQYRFEAAGFVDANEHPAAALYGCCGLPASQRCYGGRIATASGYARGALE